MIGFDRLAIFCGAEDGFVGIRKDTNEQGKRPKKEIFKPSTWQENSDFAFFLPHGFENFPKPNPENDDESVCAYNALRDIFFGLYRAFCKFERDNIDTGRLNHRSEEKQTSEDQTIKSPGGISMENLKGEECILYSKLKNIERIFHAYSDLTINSLERKIRKTQDVDFAQIHKYLENAIYLDNDVIYVDEMLLPKLTIFYETTDLILLYSYILDAILTQLQEDIQDSPFAPVKVADMIRARRQHIREFATIFRDKFLSPAQSLFDAKTHPETIAILKDVLEKIDHVTAYKDVDYWQLFEAIEAFLYGEMNPDDKDGDYWGIKGFSLLWEDICHTYFFRKEKDNILYADTDIPIPSLGKNKLRSDEENETDKARVGTIKVGTRNRSAHLNNNSYWVYATSFGKKEKVLFFQKNKEQELPLNSKHPYIDDYPLQKVEGHGPYLAQGMRPASTMIDYLSLYFDWNQGDLQYKTKISTRVWMQPNYKSRHRYIRKLQPDLVLKSDDKESLKIKILDYKYIPIDIFSYSTDKVEKDVRKSLVYEFALQQSFEVEENIFLLPNYVHDPNATEITITQDCINNLNGIKVYQANFDAFLKEYLDESAYRVGE